MSSFGEIDRIGIWANPTLGKNDGYGYAGWKMMLEMQALGINTYWNDKDAPISLSFVQPTMYGGKHTQFRIGYTPWESTIIPEEWKRPMQNRDVIWTTSEYCKEVFESNGITKPIQVVHHGIDPNDWTLSKREVSDIFSFFHMGEPADRKNGQMTIDAFLSAFPKQQDVQLIVKAHGYAECRLFEGKWGDPEPRKIIGPINMHPRIGLYTDVWPLENLNAAFGQVHCLIYPSSGEGFGLIPFQAIATGMPSIFPRYSGLKEFQEFGIPLEYTIGPSNHSYHLGDWCWPSFDDLVDKMRDVYNNYQKYADETFLNASILRQKFRWDSIVQDALKEIGVENRPIP